MGEGPLGKSKQRRIPGLLLVGSARRKCDGERTVGKVQKGG